MSIKLIVGLGNPGPEYAATRHNAGEWLIQALAHQENISMRFDSKLKGTVGALNLSNHDCRLFVPGVFMNHSGQALRTITDFYKINLNEILVAHDELDLPVGTIKLKKGGGHGGHNGLRDIIAHLNSPDFYRLRIGIGHPGHRDHVVDYVLHKPSRADQQLIDDSIANALTVFPLIFNEQFEKAMQQLHT